jgi:hypothetical protein
MSDRVFNIEERPLSFSSLKQFEESAQHYVRYREGDREQTKDMIIGSAFHTLTLEADKFLEQYYVIDDTDIIAEIGGAKPTATKAYKEWKQQQEGFAEINDRVVIIKDDYDLIQRMRDAVLSHPEAREILNACTEFEKAVEWTNQEGLPMRGFLDGFGPDIFVDLKSTRNPKPYAFQRDFFNMSYDAQYAIYSEALDELFNPVKYRKVIAIGKTEPLGVSVHNVSEEVVKLGDEKYYKWVAQFLAFRDNPEEFTVVYPGEHEITIPKYLQVEDWKNAIL